MTKKYDYLIVGAGLYGATFAYFARKHGKSCLVIDKRPHLGGNIYCERIEGINVHKYGAHIFHTSNKKVWDFVNSFVTFNRYTNSPVANYKGALYNLPFNMNTFYQVWGVTTPAEAVDRIEAEKADTVAAMREAGIDTPRNLEEQAMLLVGKTIYERLIKGYTEKQWGRPCTELPPFIIKRLPVRLVFDNNYFNDRYQGIPEGEGAYNQLIDGLLKGVETRVDADFFADRDYYESVASNIVYTGRIDEFYDFRFGQLNYRSVKFEQECIDTPNYQGNAVINYTGNEVPYTRVIEHKHFDTFGNDVYANPKTVISREYSVEWKDGIEPYYPVNDEKNSRLYEQYRKLAEGEQNVHFGGRLAEYRYYDMAPLVETVMKRCDIIFGE